jgi:hypothetical protein
MRAKRAATPNMHREQAEKSRNQVTIIRIDYPQKEETMATSFYCWASISPCVKIQHESWSKLLSCTKENITPQASLLGFVVTRPVSAVHGKKIEHTFIWDSKYEQSMDSNRLQMTTLEARCTKTKGKKPRRKTVKSGD